MTKLRRCSPEIERELHDKEARIRELYDALWVLNGHARLWITLAENVDKQVTEALATSPPDSEPAEGGDDRTQNERALEEADDSANYAYPDDTAERQDVMLERREALEEVYPEEIVYEVMSSFDGALDEPCLCGSPDGEFGCPQCSALETARNKLRQALSRTSDEGTGCVVPEAVRRLPYELRREAENRCGCCDPDATMPGCDCMNLDDARGEGRDQEKLDIASRLDRAIAQQGK